MKKLFKNQKGSSDIISIIIIVVFIGAVFITGTYIWQEVRIHENSTTQATKNSPKKEYRELISQYCQGTSCQAICNPDNCLLIDSTDNYESNQPFGLATLKGWFKTESKIDKGNKEVQCDALVLTDGTPKLINFYINEYQSDYPVINIDIDELPIETQRAIINSSEDSPVELTVFKYPPVGKGDSPCLSTIKIFEAK